MEYDLEIFIVVHLIDIFYLDNFRLILHNLDDSLHFVQRDCVLKYLQCEDFVELGTQFGLKIGIFLDQSLELASHKIQQRFCSCLHRLVVDHAARTKLRLQYDDISREVGLNVFRHESIHSLDVYFCF